MYRTLLVATNELDTLEKFIENSKKGKKTQHLEDGLSFKQRVVYHFLRKHNIRGGEYRTPMYCLYRLYRKYCNVLKYKPVSPIEFGRRMSKFFKKGKSGRFTYYFTNLYFDKEYKKSSLDIYKRLWMNKNEQKKQGQTEQSEETV